MHSRQDLVLRYEYQAKKGYCAKKEDPLRMAGMSATRLVAVIVHDLSDNWSPALPA